MKTISATFLAFAGMAWAVETQVFDLTTSVGASDSPYFYNATTGCFTDNKSIPGTVLSYANNLDKIQTNISFVLNLTAAQQLTSSTTLTLLKIDMAGDTKAGGDVGLSLTSSGVSGAWNEATSGRESVAYKDLLKEASSVFRDAYGNQCITLTMVQYASGAKLYSSSEMLWEDSKLRSDDNTVFNSITVNTSYVEAVQFSTTWPTNGDAKPLNKTFDTAARAKLMPEPTTATLSLLALVGLAARRRRA
ncbi:MAG: hypothetical protein ACI4P8_04800 [Akkermansia sp.]